MLISVPGKAFTLVLLNRVNVILKNRWWDNQAGFRAACSTADNISVLHQILEKMAEYNKNCNIVFIDFKQAFDSVDRPTLWQLLLYYSVPTKIVNLIRELYNGLQSCVKVNLDYMDFFKVTTGVCQGCILSLTLFNIDIDYLMSILERQVKAGVKLDKTVFQYLEYADNIALLAETVEMLQSLLDVTSAEAQKLGLVINPDKTKTLSVTQSDKQLPKTKLNNQIKKYQHRTGWGVHLPRTQLWQ